MASKPGASSPAQVTFRFSKDENYRLIPVNGAWGGVTPRGDVQVELFHENHAMPTTVVHSVTEGRVAGELKRTPKAEKTEVQRTVLAGMVLTAEQAESIGRWLQAKAREARERGATKERDREQETPTTH